jgi:acyl carrier protein
MTNIKRREEIRDLLGEILTGKGDADPFPDGESLILGGRLQSMDVLMIVMHLEERYGVDFSEGFDPLRLDSVDGLLAFLEETAP